jgi:hypothetical protein
VSHSQQSIRRGLTLPGPAEVNQHCLVESYSMGTGSSFTRQRDFLTVRIESLHGPGNAWVDYEIPGIVPRQEGPRGQFDPVSRGVAFTFPIDQPPAGSSLVIHAGADNITHQDHYTLTPPALCGQTSGNGTNVKLPYGNWSNFAKVRFTQQCVPAADGPPHSLGQPRHGRAGGRRPVRGPSRRRMGGLLAFKQR